MSLDPTLSRRQAPARVRAPRLPRVPPKALLALVLTAVVTAGGWLWLRESSLVKVQEVTVTGATSSEQAEIQAALDAAGREMTTLHVREDNLRKAVAPFSSVADISVKTDFPHELRVHVIEHEPVAALVVGGREIAASADGLLLDGVVAGGEVPVIRMDAAPAGERVTNANTRSALAIAGAAPDELRARIDRLWTGSRGMMLALVDGPDLIFGDHSDAARKWLAAARVLADPSSAGATYLDVRTPERVAAGGLGPVAEPTAEPTTDSNPQP